MLGAELRDDDGAVGGVDNFLLDAVNLIAEDDGVAGAGGAAEVLERHGVLGLLCAEDRVALGPEFLNKADGAGAVLPGDAVLGSEGRFVDLGARGSGADAAEPQLVRLEGVCRAEGAADVVRTAYVVQYQYDAARGQFLVGLGAYAPELYVEKFSVSHTCAKVQFFLYLKANCIIEYETGHPAFRTHQEGV